MSDRQVRAADFVARIPPEAIIAAVGIAAALSFPDYLAFLTRINIQALFVLSLSLVIGQAGIGTLGQAAMFGSGAYAAALWALHVSPEPPRVCRRPFYLSHAAMAGSSLSA